MEWGDPRSRKRVSGEDVVGIRGKEKVSAVAAYGQMRSTAQRRRQ